MLSRELLQNIMSITAEIALRLLNIIMSGQEILVRFYIYTYNMRVINKSLKTIPSNSHRGAFWTVTNGETAREVYSGAMAKIALYTTEAHPRAILAPAEMRPL